ncbi:unnamed protein product [Durusdinium trenchii]|uniref:SET domain-containing protein n=1 Tax=Durusdinium trenchii TaxID=1381693 RepID=A0ABP0SUI4_9DINO
MITGALGALILLLGCWAQHLGHEEAKAKWTTLGEWLALRGGYLHRGLEPSLVSHGGLSMMGIVSTVLLPEGAVAIELPRLALLDLELLGSIPEYLDLASSTPSCSISSGFQRSMRNLKLLTILAREKAKGPASDFASYLELLPSKVNLEESDVYYAGEDLLKDFKVLPVINFWRRIQAEHYKELESCFEALKMQRPMETAGVLWKDVEVLLRTHRSRYFAISQPSLEFLGPGADWVNTGTRTEQNVKAVLTISGKHQEMTLQFVASRDLKPGEELILSYFTGLDNEDILFRWNMYLEGNDISLDAGDTATVCSAGGQDLRSASLEMLDLNVERQVPRCRDSGKRQGVLRCSLARLAYELCVGSWFPERSAVNPAPQTPASRSKGSRPLLLGWRAMAIRLEVIELQAI